MRRLFNDQVTLEVSLTSNLALGAVAGLPKHPALIFANAGIPLCFNTDVPVHTRMTLPDEFRLASELLGVSFDDIRAIQIARIESAFDRTLCKQPEASELIDDPAKATAGDAH